MTLLAPHEFAELKQTFDQAAKTHADLMEPYVILLESADGQEDQQDVMWSGLRDTIKQRYPLGEVA